MRPARSVPWFVPLAILAIAFGIVLNPLLTTAEAMWTTVLIAEVLLGGLWVACEFHRAYRRDPAREQVVGDNVAVTAAKRTFAMSKRGAIALVALLVVWGFLFRDRWLRPTVSRDDHHYLEQSADWETTRRSLFVPYNEHLVTASRLWTYALVALFDGPNLPRALALGTIPLFVLATLLVFEFARRLSGREADGVLAAIFFALTTSYREIIDWYSASQWLITLDLMLCALIVSRPLAGPVARWRIAAATLLSVAAPFTFSIGFLVGPIVSAWLSTRPGQGAVRWRRGLATLAPTLGAVAAGFVIVPILSRWFASDAYLASGGRGVERNFEPVRGVIIGCRLIADQLIIGNLGGREILEDHWNYGLVMGACIGAVVAGLRAVPAVWRLWPTLLMIALPYATAMPFRTWMAYETLVGWTRYQLIPQLGLALLLAGFVAVARDPHGSAPSNGIGRTELIVLLFLMGLLAWLHEGRGLS